MKKWNCNDILRQVAAENGVTLQEVRAGIQETIDVCWNNPDPAIHAKWAAMSPRGEKPSVEEALLFLATLAATEQQMRQEEKHYPFCYLPQ